MVAFELYPWHWASVTGPIRPDPTTIARYVWEPIAALGQPLVFAFGSPWFPLLRDALGLDVAAHLGFDGQHYGSRVASRDVLVLRAPSGIAVVAEKYAGSAGPPAADEITRLRDAVERVLK